MKYILVVFTLLITAKTIERPDNYREVAAILHNGKL